MIRKSVFALSALIVATTLGAIGYWMLFSSFAPWDDEGYILLSAREHFARGALYDRTYSQYGPAFYGVMDAFQCALGAPVDHTSARFLTLAFWLGASGLSASLVWRGTASRSLSLFTLPATFLYLYFIIDEPFHPGSSIFFLLAASLAVITRQLAAGKIAAAAAVAGGTAAFLFLTKINVGALYLSAVTGWAILHAPSKPKRGIVGPAVAGLFILLAGALMYVLLNQSWVQIYLAVFSGGALALVITMKSEPLVERREAGCFLAAGLAVGAPLLTFIWLRGTSWAHLLDGVLLGPLDHASHYSYPVDWRPGTLLVTGLSLTLAIAHPWICRRFSNESGDRLIVFLRLVLMAALLTGFAVLMNLRAVGAIFSYVAPLIWIWVIPLTTVRLPPSAHTSRGLLATILLLQYLQAYPVGGSQESWGTFLFIPLAALGMGEVRLWLACRHSADGPLIARWSVIRVAIMIVVIAKVGFTAVVTQRKYAAGSALNLPGATRLHLPESQAASYRILALNAAVHADTLFSLPGLFSFNLWTDLPTPTPKNTTIWFSLLDTEEQKDIIRVLAQTPRACLIVHHGLIAQMQANPLPLEGELWDYIHQNFRTTFQSDSLAFWVHKGRAIAPFNVATVSHRTQPDPTRHLADTQLEFCLVHDGTPIAAIEMRTGLPHQPATYTLNATNAEASISAITSSGQMLAAPVKVDWPLRRSGLLRVFIRFDANDRNLLPDSTLLYLKNQQGEKLGEIKIGQ